MQKSLKRKKNKSMDSFVKLVETLADRPELIDTFDDTKLPKFIKVVKYHLRNKCRKDLYFLAKYILGHKEMNWRFHKPICNLMQEVNYYVKHRKSMKEIPESIRNRLWLIFRGSFKTTVLTISHSVQLMLIDPNIRICLASNKLDNAKGMLLSIKIQFMQNPVLRFLFPEYCPSANKDGKVEWGTSTSITLPNRNDLTIKEGTIECAGVDTGLISRHYDYMKKDDLVTDKSVNTQEQIESSINWDRLSISLFDVPEKGFNDWIGTIYHEMDLYGHLLKRNHKKLFRYLMKAETSEGIPIFPERFTKKGLDAIREDQGEYIYSCQYLLEPIAEKDRRFRPEWFKTYDKIPDRFSICILVDPASARKRGACYTSMVVHAIVREEGTIKWYLVDGVFDKLSVTQRVNKLFALAKKWREHLRIVSYETIGFQESDKVFLKTKMDKEDFHFSIREIDGQAVSKEGRIEGLVPFYEYGKILFPKTLLYYSTYHGRMIDIVDVIKYELLRFPQAEHLDFIDAQSQQLRYPFAAPMIAKPDTTPQPGSFMFMRAKLKSYNSNPLRRHYSMEEVWDKIKV